MIIVNFAAILKGTQLQNGDIIRFGKIKFRIKGIQTSKNTKKSIDLTINTKKVDNLVLNSNFLNREVKIFFSCLEIVFS